jgi:hypothetical protein
VSNGGALRALAVIEAADALAAWEPADLADVFGVLAALPDVLGAVAEAAGVVAVTAEDAHAVKSWVTSAAEEAAAWSGRAAAGLGEMYAPDPWLRSSGPRWLPPPPAVKS